MIAPDNDALAATVYRDRAPETTEAVAYELLRLILLQDRSLTSRATNQPVAAYILDLFAECLSAANGNRNGDGAPRH
jgi:hypothetical protein